jgi:hypothetical protein
VRQVAPTPWARRGALAVLLALAVLALRGGAREAAESPAPDTHAAARGTPARGTRPGAAVDAVTPPETGPVVPLSGAPGLAERQGAAARAEARADDARRRLFASNLASLDAAAEQADAAGSRGYAEALRRRRDALADRVR